MSEKVTAKIVVEVEYELNSVPPHLLVCNIQNHLNMHLKRVLNSAWEDWAGNDPTINSLHIDVTSEDI